MERNACLRIVSSAWAMGLLLSIVGGCAAPMTMRPGDPTSPTGGYAVLFAESDRDEMTHRRYELFADGTFEVGGGKIAQIGETDWTTQPSSESIHSILSAVREAGLLDHEPPCTPSSEAGVKEPRSVTIEVVGPDIRRSYALKGNCPTLDPLRAALANAASARYQRHLDALPEAGQRGTIRRR